MVLFRETWTWDVRTKHVTCETIPTINGVRGLANYGVQGNLFTLGPNHTVQQYDLTPPKMTKEAQFDPMGPPPVPNKSLQGHYIPGTAPPMPVSRNLDRDRGPVSLSTIQRSTNDMHAIDHARHLREEVGSPMSSASRTDTMSSRSSNRYAYQRHVPSISSRAPSGTTFSTISPSMVGRESLFSGGTSAYPSTASMASSGRRSKGSRLRQEVIMSPESSYIDLFPRTRIRLSNIAHNKQTQPLDQDNMYPDELRRQMLAMVFGWEDDIEPLIRDELAHHQAGSSSAVLLAKWLGEVDSDLMSAATESGTMSSGDISSADWMMLALSSMGSSGPAGTMGKMGQAFVQRLLQKGDFHTSATILLGLGDREDAVEVYVSRSFYMEAILLTCLVFPTDWERQAHLVRRWGEFVVENSQQHLAIRCFSCTGVEPPMTWGSPSPRPFETPSQTPSSISSMLSPPISPPPTSQPVPPTRMTTKNSALKVITSFDAPNQAQFRFPGLNSTDRTPTNAPGVTPIAESAIPPAGTPRGFDRRQNWAMNSSTKRAITPGGHHQNRLPSIGETPVDVTAPQFPRPSQLPTPDNSGSDLEREKGNQFKNLVGEEKAQKDTEQLAPLLLSSARYDPGSATGKSPMTALPTTSVRTTILPSPSQDAFTGFKEEARARNGSRDRKPDGLHIRMPSQDQIQTTHVVSQYAVGSIPSERRRSNTSNSLHSASLSTGRSDIRSDTKSSSISGQSWESGKSPSISGRSIDPFINSLEEAGYRSRRQKHTRKRHESREGRTPAGEHKSRSKPRTQERSEDRSHDDRRYVRPAKRSPSSPKPMSPDLHRDPVTGEILDHQIVGVHSPVSEARHAREDNAQGVVNIRSGSKASDHSHRTVRHRSPEGMHDSRFGSEASFGRSRVRSRQSSPRAARDPSGRGRSRSKIGGSLVRSPSSPLPMSPQAKHYQASDEDEDPLRIVAANRQRLRSKQRSSSRRARERGNSSRRDTSADHRPAQEDRHLRVPGNNKSIEQPRSAVEPRHASGDQMLNEVDLPKLHHQKSERSQKRELAARELEARRISLLRNPEAPQIIHPDEVNNARPALGNRSHTDLSNSPNTWDPIVLPPQHSRRYPSTPVSMDSNDVIHRTSSAGPYGLPATPRAMRHPKYDNKASDLIPAVPEIPDSVHPPPEMYYTGHPTRDLPRSMSAPVPDQELPPLPVDLPTHPAFHKALRPGKRSTFSPLDEIGQHRRRPSSSEAQSMLPPPVTVGIDETIHAHDSQVEVVNVDEPQILPELQHLSFIPPPPPPPPPPPFSHRSDPESSSLSSSSGVGVIKMVLDNEPEDETNVFEVPPPPPPHPVQSRLSPPPNFTASSPHGINRAGSSRRRGRSDNFKNGIKGITDRLRSNSRGRNTTSPEQTNNAPSPYESVPPLYF